MHSLRFSRAIALAVGLIAINSAQAVAPGILQPNVDEAVDSSPSPAGNPASLLRAVAADGKSLEERFDAFRKKINLKIAKSFDDEATKRQPASIFGTSSRNDPDFTIVDVSVKAGKRWMPGNGYLNDLSGFTEFHRNDRQTADKKEQRLYKAGVTARLAEGRNVANDWNHIWTLTAAYKNDRISAGEGFSLSAAWSPQFKARGISHVRNGLIGVYPVLALQNEHGDALDKSAGHVTRGKAGALIAFFPFENIRLEFVAGGNIWHNFEKTGPFARYHREQKQFYGSVYYWFNADRNFGFGLDHSDGANPETGIKGDRTTAFGIKITF